MNMSARNLMIEETPSIPRPVAQELNHSRPKSVASSNSDSSGKTHTHLSHHDHDSPPPLASEDGKQTDQTGIPTKKSDDPESIARERARPSLWKGWFGGRRNVGTKDAIKGIVGNGKWNERSSTIELEGGEETMAAVNASGHPDRLKRIYGALEICGTAMTVDNAWVALGGSITVSLSNGGPPGVLYELIVSFIYYIFIGLSLSELASSMPSAGGVYHWASVTPGLRLGRIIGFFAGLINFYGWVFDLASITTIPANVVVQIYATFHEGFVVQPWHRYVTYVLIVWLSTLVVIFFNSILPKSQNLGMFWCLGGGLVTIIALATVPHHHASNRFVWTEWNNETGWPGAISFLTGVLNGAFTLGTPDSVTHLAEELEHPKTDLPKAIVAQLSLGFFTAFCYAVALMYSITDLPAILSSPVSGSFPLAAVYSQAMNHSRSGTTCLLVIVLISNLLCVIGTFIVVGRLWWTLARDNVVPWSKRFSEVDEHWNCPVWATLFCAVLVTGLGAIQLGSKTAFTDLVGSFVILTTTSYLLCIVPHLLSFRRHAPRGPFWLGAIAGPIINGIAAILIVFFNTLFCFPATKPTTVVMMNYNSVILTGLLFITTLWWFLYGTKHYHLPNIPHVKESQIKIFNN